MRSEIYANVMVKRAEINRKVIKTEISP
jgi:hypothetical protein